MSGKIVKIESCMECKYHIRSQMDGVLIYCQHEDNPYDGQPVIPDFPRIPDWCELEDDLIPALDRLQGHYEQGARIIQHDSNGRYWVLVYQLIKHTELVASGKTIRELLVNLKGMQ